MSEENPAGEPTPAAAAPEPTPSPSPAPAAEEPVTAPSASEAPTVGSPVAEAPTAEAPAATPPAQAAAAEPVAAETAIAEPERRRGVFVPVWAAVAVGILVVAGLGFLVGYLVAPSDDSSPSAASSTQPAPATPDFPNPGQGNGSGGSGGGNAPSAPAVDSAYLGVGVEAAAGAGGATLASVENGSPAAKAGLEAGDVITAVDDTDVSSPLDLVRAIRAHEAGDSVTITYTRDGASADAKVTFSSRPTSSTTG